MRAPNARYSATCSGRLRWRSGHQCTVTPGPDNWFVRHEPTAGCRRIYGPRSGGYPAVCPGVTDGDLPGAAATPAAAHSWSRVCRRSRARYIGRMIFPESGKIPAVPGSSPPSDTTSAQVRASLPAPGKPRDAALMLRGRSLCFPPLDQRGEQLGGLALTARQDVRVDLHRDRGAGAAEALGNRLDRLAVGQTAAASRACGGGREAGSPERRPRRPARNGSVPPVRDGDQERGAAPWRAGDLDPAADCLNAIPETDEP